jgi:hypothetical protein
MQSILRVCITVCVRKYLRESRIFIFYLCCTLLFFLLSRLFSILYLNQMREFVLRGSVFLYSIYLLCSSSFFFIHRGSFFNPLLDSPRPSKNTRIYLHNKKVRDLALMSCIIFIVRIITKLKSIKKGEEEQNQLMRVYYFWLFSLQTERRDL